MCEIQGKTPFLGFLVTIESTTRLASSLLLGEAPPLRYLLTYKLSQDHIELFFGALRSRGGWNNNPMVSQFVAAYRRLAVHNEVKRGRGNCVSLDESRILYVSSGVCARDELDMSTAKRNGSEDLLRGAEIREKSKLGDKLKSLPQLSPYIGNIVGYIAAFVCRMVQQRIPCTTCHMATIAKICHSALLT